MSKQTPKMLIVEDAPEVADIIKIAFRRTELDIHHAPDGLKGLEYLKAEVPDVIILDLGMPGMGGWEFLERVREQEAMRRVPVIVLTAHTDYQNRKTGKLFEVAAYLQKPIDLVALRTAIDDAIYLKH